MYPLALARPVVWRLWRLTAMPAGSAVDTGTAHSAGSGVLSITVLLLLVLVLGVMLRRVMAAAAELLGQIVRLMGMLLLALLIAVLLLAGMLSHASGSSPAPAPSPNAPHAP